MLTSLDLHFFAAVCEAKSLAAAARALDVTPPAVTRRLQGLEARLGLKLLDRTPGRLQLTGEGEVLKLKAADILAQIGGLEEALSERRGTVRGTLRVVAPMGFGRIYVAPVMAQMRLRFPETALTLVLTDQPYEALRMESWDVMLHVGRLGDSAHIQRKLAPNRRLLCAAPSYLQQRGAPDCPQALTNLDCGVVREDKADVSLWSLKGERGARQTVRVQPAFDCNDGEVIKAWALAGLGIVERSEWSIAAELRAGSLVEVLPGWKLPDADVVALLGPRAQRPARADRFVALLVESLDPVPWRAKAGRSPRP